MPRSYRCIVLAIVGCLAASQAYGQQQGDRAGDSTQRDQAQATTQAENSALSAIANSADAIVREIAPTEQEKADTRNETERSKQDLVAQQDSARWAWIIMFLTGGQLILSAVGIYFIIRTLRQGGLSLRTAFSGLKQAGRAARAAEASIRVAERSAAAAEAQVRVSEDTAKRQLRAYLAATEIKITASGPDMICGNVTISNQGATPARIKKVTEKAWIGPPTKIKPHEDGPAPSQYHHVRDLLSHGVPDFVFFVTKDVEGIATLGAETAEFYVYGRIEYEDIFGDPQWMTYAFRLEGYEPSADAAFTTCIYGNDGS